MQKSLDDIVRFMIDSAREAEERRQDRPITLHDFRVERKARQLVAPARARAEHHRGREKFYTAQLEESEKLLREKGISMEVFDPLQGFSMAGVSLTSGGISSPGQQFQPKIDQTMLDAVKRAKTKMLEHRDKAEKFEKYVRAFSCARLDVKIELTVEEVHMFLLEDSHA
jgi:hypothetical protein